MPRVSVVLPTYNAGGFVDEALDSLLSQSFANFELLVIDDGSTDRTTDIVRGYERANDRVRLIERESSGLPSALNRGIEEATGEFVARQDADDRSHPERLARQVAFLEEHTDVALVGTGTYVLKGGQRVERRHVIERPTLADMEGSNPFVHGSVCFRRDQVEAVGGYDESFEVSEDYDLWVRLADRFPVANIDEPLYELRLRDNSIYGSDLERVKLYRRYALARLRDDLPDGAHQRVDAEGIMVLYEFLDDDERADHHAEMAMELLRYGNLSEARHHARSSLSFRPIQPTVNVMWLLSFTTQEVVDMASRLYRVAKNHQVRSRNR